MSPEKKSCSKCSQDFFIAPLEKEFIIKVSPVIAGERYDIPEPTLCPSCRQQRRICFRSERSLYKRKCDATGKEMVSIYSPVSPHKVYHQDYWWNGNWDPLDTGKEFDFSQAFFPQFHDLYKATPQMSLLVIGNENCEFTNMTARSKNCYFTFGAGDNKDCAYCRWLIKNESIVDCNNCMNCQHLYECIDCINLSISQYCIGCSDSSECYGCYDLQSCHNCIGCYNLRNKNYCIDNVEFTKEEYLKRKQDILVNRELLMSAYKKAIHRCVNNFASEKVSGDYIVNSKNVTHGFDIKDAQDCLYIANADKIDNCQHIDFQAENTSFSYETIAFETGVNILFCFCFIGGVHMYYSISCFDCSHCFGCVSLRNKEYCIFNKQYTKEEYEILVPQIIEHMKKMGEWGEFFPATLSAFGYNETIVQEYYPLTREEAIKQGFNWSDYEAPFPKVEKIIPANKLPKNISEVPDDILNWAIECAETKRPFRITSLELEFYRTHGVSIPLLHPDVRHLRRMRLRNPRKLFERTCHKCKKNIQTTYMPEWKEKVYCEECYEKEIF